MDYVKSYGEILKDLGYRKVHTGTRMLEYAAEYMAAQSPAVSMTKHVYPAVERAFEVENAERSMRYAARKAGDSRTVAQILWDLVDEGVPD